jgi:hypothetical protein
MRPAGADCPRNARGGDHRRDRRLSWYRHRARLAVDERLRRTSATIAQRDVGRCARRLARNALSMIAARTAGIGAPMTAT